MIKSRIEKLHGTNVIRFYNQKGNRVYPISFSGNLYEFENGQIVKV